MPTETSRKNRIIRMVAVPFGATPADTHFPNPYSEAWKTWQYFHHTGAGPYSAMQPAYIMLKIPDEISFIDAHENGQEYRWRLNNIQPVTDSTNGYALDFPSILEPPPRPSQIYNSQRLEYFLYRTGINAGDGSPGSGISVWGIPVLVPVKFNIVTPQDGQEYEYTITNNYPPTPYPNNDVSQIWNMSDGGYNQLYPGNPEFMTKCGSSWIPTRQKSHNYTLKSQGGTTGLQIVMQRIDEITFVDPHEQGQERTFILNWPDDDNDLPTDTFDSEAACIGLGLGAWSAGDPEPGVFSKAPTMFIDADGAQGFYPTRYVNGEVPTWIRTDPFQMAVGIIGPKYQPAGH